MQDIQPTFRAIADPTRRAIIGMLADKEMTVGDVASHFDMTRPAVAKHLGILREGGLVTVRAEGRERVHTLDPHALRPVEQWIEHFSHFWDTKLSALKTAIEKDES
ncbi:MAG: transcriptional regulator [Kordiimonadales bacterium]|nr:MAG: transcriptional regulator [Kordiimonadales bacterium]